MFAYQLYIMLFGLGCVGCVVCFLVQRNRRRRGLNSKKERAVLKSEAKPTKINLSYHHSFSAKIRKDQSFHNFRKYFEKPSPNTSV